MKSRQRATAAIIRCLLLAISILVPDVPQAQAAAAPRPNVVFLLADDLGSHDVGWRGSDIKTPNLDRLALAGARLDQFYVQPVCSPTRAALMTGRYPFRHGLQVSVVRPWAQYGLPLEERTLPQALAEAGYETAIVGKWHLGHFRPEYLPTRRGFAHQYGHYNGALDYFTHIRDGGFDWHRDDHECRDEGYATHLLAKEAMRVIRERDKARPLFLYVPFNAVHSPLQVPPSYEEAYKAIAQERRTYAGMVAAMDEAVGQIKAAIDEAGMSDQTLFVFSSDNGGPSPGTRTSNGPLRAGKGTLYEGGVRVCAFATWEGRIKPGAVTAPLHMVDWYPTLLGLAGASPEQKLPIDGRDLWPVLTGSGGPPHDEILLNSTPRQGAIRVADWKLVINGHVPNADGDEGGADSRKDAGSERVALFDLAADPGEKQDRAAEKPRLAAQLRARYDFYAAQAVPPKSHAKPRGFKSPKVWGEADE
ncbi:MAG: arylsulfatase [Planctomycetia bacterium]|nr:arylsulfatase [Planctomycetia bacterium]